MNSIYCFRLASTNAALAVATGGVIDTGKQGSTLIWPRIIILCLMAWALLAGLINDAKAQAWSLQPEHFLAAPLAEAAKVYEARVAARQAAEKKQWGDAIIHWDQLLSFWPDDLEALNGKANILSVELSKPEAALAVREVAAKAVPWNVDNRYQLCELYFSLKRYREAIQECETALELLHGHTSALTRIADIKLLSGEHKEASILYRELIGRIDTQDQFDKILSNLNSLSSEGDSSSSVRAALIVELKSLWKSEEMVGRRAARLALAEAFKSRLEPVMTKMVNGGGFDGSIDILGAVDVELEAVRRINISDASSIQGNLALMRGFFFVSTLSWSDALLEIKRFEDAFTTTFGRGHPTAISVIEWRVLMTMLRPAANSEKESTLYSLLNLSRQTYGAHSQEARRSLNIASRIYQFSGDVGGRTAALTQAQAIVEGLTGAASTDAVDALGGLIKAMEHAGEENLAEPVSRRYVYLLEISRGADDPIVIGAKLGMAKLLMQMEHLGEAVILIEGIRDIYLKAPKSDTKLGIDIKNTLNSAYRRLGKTDEKEQQETSVFGGNSPSPNQSLNNFMQNFYKSFGMSEIDEGESLVKSGSIDAGILKIESGNAKLSNMFGDDTYFVAGIEYMLSEFKNKAGKFNSVLARTTNLLETQRNGNEIPVWVASRLWWSRTQAAFGLRRFSDIYDSSIKYWALVSRMDAHSTLSAQALFNLSIIAAAQERNSVSIFLSKAAVNMVQRRRAGLGNLRDELQQDFLKKHSKTYQFLSVMLIDRSRVVEAEQVLQMLKELELRELTPRSKVGASLRVTLVDLGGAEQRAQQRMDALLDTGTDLQAELTRTQHRLKLVIGDEAENQRRITELESKLKSWEVAMRTFLDNLPKELPEVGTPGSEQESENAKGRLQAVVQRDAATVGLQFVVTEDRLGIIVASREGTVGRFSQVSRVELSQLVIQLRTAILSKADTREPAQALWKALLGPVEADLERLGTRTLLLASTDVLRYLPFAALQDGEGRYLIERYALANWLAAAPDPKPRQQAVSWQVAALGVTRAQPGFPALPGVRREILGIVRSMANPAGALPGRAYLDDEFDLQHLDDAIGGGGNVVHVASHFTFRPGDERRSVLLMGRGDPVSMASLARRDFAKVEQLTLSACETATGGGYNETGAEVEGLAALLLVKQARSVMGTLWKVADASTAQLMVTYYRQLQGSHAGGRAAALREAQLQLLHGQAAVAADRSTRGARPLVPGAGIPTITNSQSPWSHPYYWAPFVISGDWL